MLNWMISSSYTRTKYSHTQTQANKEYITQSCRGRILCHLAQNQIDAYSSAPATHTIIH